MLATLYDAFITIMLPRAIGNRRGITQLYYGVSWRLYRPLVLACPPGRVRQWLLTVYPPASVLLLLGLWATLIPFGYALVEWGLRSDLGPNVRSFGEYLYFSGVTFFTLGYGDLVPRTGFSRTLAVVEVAIGLAFLALLIGHVPALSGIVSRREAMIVLLDTKAGSDPTGFELLRRYAAAGALPRLEAVLADYERWSAEMLEAYLSYPMVAYYRSQHDDQSWLRALTAVLDACAWILAYVDDESEWGAPLRFQARSTLATGRHLLVDFAYVVHQPPIEGRSRCEEGLAATWSDLAAAGLPQRPLADGESRLRAFVRLYEPFAVGLGEDMMLELPAWRPAPGAVDHWQTSAWEGARHF